MGNFGLLDLGAPELLVILLIVLVLFGGSKLPALSRSLGESVKEFKKNVGDASELRADLSNQAKEMQKGLRGEKSE